MSQYISSTDQRRILSGIYWCPSYHNWLLFSEQVYKNLFQTKDICARRDSFENVTEVWQKDYAKEAKDAKVDNLF